jgi:hypothetical protein
MNSGNGDYKGTQGNELTIWKVYFPLQWKIKNAIQKFENTEYAYCIQP